MLRGFSYRFEHAGNICFLLQFLQHPALEPPFVAKVNEVLECIAFFQPQAAKGHLVGHPAACIHTVGVIGIGFAPIPVVHEKCVTVVIVKIKGTQDRLAQCYQGLLLADPDMAVAAATQRHLDHITLYLAGFFFLRGLRSGFASVKEEQISCSSLAFL